MNFMLFIIKFTKFKPIIKFNKFECHNYAHRDSPGAAVDAASVHFGPTTRRTDILVSIVISGMRIAFIAHC